MFVFHVIPYMFTSYVLPSVIDLHSVDVILGASVLTHISLLHASIVAHMQDPYNRFCGKKVHTRKLFPSLLIVLPVGFVITIIELSNIYLASA